MSTQKPKRQTLTDEQKLERARANAARLEALLLVPKDVRKDLNALARAAKIADKYNASDYASGIRTLHDGIRSNAIAAATK